MLKRPGFISRPLSSYPFLLNAVIYFRRMERFLEWRFDKHHYACQRKEQSLEYRVKKHQSVLIRKLPGADITLQKNKVHNLKIVLKKLDGIIINPGETFSFCKLVGKPSKSRGFLPGMELSRGQARAGIGGGICQVSNLIYWLCLHSALDIVERHHHSFDPFPDQGRVLPFASGATVMYNYRDLRFKNNTDKVFQFKFWLDKKCLNGDLRCSSASDYSYKVFERNHRFIENECQYFRGNELWRRVIDKKSGGSTLRCEHLVNNLAEVKYTPSKESLNRLSSV